MIDANKTTATVQTLMPVHIGNGIKRLNGTGFIRQEKRIGFVDFDKVIALKGNDPSTVQKTIKELTSIIEGRETKRSIIDILPRNYRLEDVSSVVAQSINHDDYISELKEHFRTSLKGAAIPGSSIKGAIRTIIWNHILERKRGVKERMTTQSLKNKRGKWDDADLAKVFFGPDANKNMMRFLKIGDAHFPDVQTEIDIVEIMNAQGANTELDWRFKERSRFMAELLPMDRESESFELKLDTVLFQRNKEKNPQDWDERDATWLTGGLKNIADIANSYMLKLLDKEFQSLEAAGFHNNETGNDMLDYYNDVYKATKALQDNGEGFVLRVGANSGWTFMTGGWILDETIHKGLKTDRDGYEQLRRDIQKNRAKSVYPDFYPMPKTRKMTVDGLPMGFIKVVFK